MINIWPIYQWYLFSIWSEFDQYLTNEVPVFDQNLTSIWPTRIQYLTEFDQYLTNENPVFDQYLTFSLDTLLLNLPKTQPWIWHIKLQLSFSHNPCVTDTARVCLIPLVVNISISIIVSVPDTSYCFSFLSTLNIYLILYQCVLQKNWKICNLKFFF